MTRPLPPTKTLASVLLFGLLLFSSSSVVESKKKKSSAEWARAASAIDAEERKEWEREQAEAAAEAERQRQLSQPEFDMNDPGSWIEAQGGVENAMAMQGGMMGGTGGGGGHAMTFVHLNNETVSTKEQAEELVVQWRDLLMTAGIEVGVYVIEPHLLLLDTSDKSKVIQIKDFIVNEAPGGEDHVEYFEVNQQKFYPESKDPNPTPEWEKPGAGKKKKKKGQLRAFNTLAKEFMSVAMDRSEDKLQKLEKRAKEGEGMLQRLRSEAEKESAAYYIKTMRKLIDGSTDSVDYPSVERRRIQGMLDSVSAAKRETFEKRYATPIASFCYGVGLLLCGWQGEHTQSFRTKEESNRTALEDYRGGRSGSTRRTCEHDTLLYCCAAARADIVSLCAST